jgi:hypothetical protein
MEQENKLTINVEGGTEADADDLAQVTQRLRAELLELDVDEVEHARSADAPKGAKGAALTAIGSLVVTLAPIVVPALVTTVQSWLRRNNHLSLTLERGGEKIKLTGHPTQEQQQIIKAWLRRQAPGK